MKTMKSLNLCAVSAFLLILSGGCYTPFIPVAIPNHFSIKPKSPLDQKKILRELEALQNVGHPEYRIEPNDVFAVTVSGQKDMSRPSVLVMPDGSIHLAPVGKVKIVGLTLSAAGKLLNEKYKKYLRLPSVMLEPIKIKEQVFTVGGKVVAPGIYPVLNGTTRLTDAIAMAKGLLSGTFKDEPIDYADLSNSYISRNGKILPVNFVKALVDGDKLHNIPILNGDYIYIAPLASGKVTILGEVKNPTSVVFQPKLTLIQALGFAGGLQVTNCAEIKVIRGGLMNPVVYTLPIDEILMGKLMDFPLKPLDIVYVPRDALSKWNVVMQKILPTFQVLNSMAGPFGNSAAVFYNN